ncbi:PA14 domain-containing protein [Opitutales bacterium]|nr:PA14 domain-containing protein [Opitutales bacterium]
MKSLLCRIQALLITLSLCCAAPLSAADAAPAAEPAKPAPWHVPNAELRVQVKVTVDGKVRRDGTYPALLRMPPQVYLADLKPLKVTGGLAFDPKTKSAIKHDIRKPEEKAATIAREKERYKKAKTEWDPKAYGRLGEKEGGPIMRASGSATYAIKPDYKYFSNWSVAYYPENKILIDGKLVPYQRVVTIPAGAKTLTIEVHDPNLRQAGFITRGPDVARASICVPGRDPSRLVPIAYRLGGERVGCQTVWAEAGKPMRIFFDSSSADEDYWVYLVDKAKQPAPLDWEPQAELVEEVRSLDRYDPKLETLDGFEKLWKESAAIMGRGVPLRGRSQSGPNLAARKIIRSSMSFRSKGSDRLNVPEALASRPAWFSRLSATFQIPATDQYRFFCQLEPQGYLLLDGQLLAPFLGKTNRRFFDIEIEKGRHRIEILQYARAGQDCKTGLWWRHLINKKGYEIFGHSKYNALEPMADATSGPLETSGAQASWASFSWHQGGNLGAVYPGHDLNWYRLSAHAPGGATNAVYRWRFDDGRTAEGQQVTKLFLRSGMRKVQLEVLDAPGGKVIARAAGEVNVQINLAFMADSGARHQQDDIWAFAEEEETLAQLPLDDLVNLYEWSYPLKHWGASSKVHDRGTWRDWSESAQAVKNGKSKTAAEIKEELYLAACYEARELTRRRTREALGRRVDEVIAAYPYSQLLQIAQSLSRKANSPTDASYAVAEKLLTVVMDRSPAGSSHWREAVLGLSDIKLLVRGEAELAVSLLKKLEQVRPSVDMLESWQFAEARAYHTLLPRDKLAGLTQGLDWSPVLWEFRTAHNWGLSFIYPFDKGRGFWMAKTFDLPPGWKGKQLIFKYGVTDDSSANASSANVWINGEPLGGMWQWPDGNIIIPERVLKKGGENRITWLIQPPPSQEWGQLATSPSVSADLSRSAFLGHQAKPDTSILIRDLDPLVRRGKRKARGLGKKTVLGGMLYDMARSLVLSPDGRRIAAGYEFGKVRVWDADAILEGKNKLVVHIGHDNGKDYLAPSEAHTIRVAPVGVVSLAFSPDGKRLATGSEDARITLLDPVSGKVLRSSIGHASTVLALAFSPDGKRLASASHDRTVKIWGTASGKELLTLTGHAGPVYAVVFSPDGKSVATAIDDSHIRLWDATTGAALRTLKKNKGEVLSLAFSPDGKRLAASSSEGFVNQWDLASGKKLTMVHDRKDEWYASRAAMVTKVLYSPDGKQLFSLGIGVGRQWDSETGAEADEFADFGIYATPKQVTLRRTDRGADQPAEGSENFPIELYSSKACDEIGMNYASYYGKWDTLPDFDELKPVKQGVLRQIDSEHLYDIMLPYRKFVKKDGKTHRTQHPSALKLTGYLKVKKAGDYAFSLKSDSQSRLVVGSKTVIETDGLKDREARERGNVHLEPGVHAFVLSYSAAADPHNRWLDVTFSREFVRSLTVGDIDSSHLMAGALLAQGKPEEAKALLIKLHRGGWPLSDTEQGYVEQARMRIRRLAGTESPSDHGHALELIDTSLATYPMLRLDPEFMVSAIAVYASMGDPRAAILAEQMLEAEMNGGQRRLLIMTQVKIKLNAGDLPGAGKVYQKLKALAPQSEETIAARELIKAAVIKKK